MPTKWGDSPLQNFIIHRIAKAEAGYNYYLYIHPKGKSIIMREKEDETEYLYADSEFGESKWSDRAILTYDTYDKIFVK